MADAHLLGDRRELVVARVKQLATLRAAACDDARAIQQSIENVRSNELCSLGALAAAVASATTPVSELALGLVEHIRATAATKVAALELEACTVDALLEEHDRLCQSAEAAAADPTRPDATLAACLRSLELHEKALLACFRRAREPDFIAFEAGSFPDTLISNSFGRVVALPRISAGAVSAQGLNGCPSPGQPFHVVVRFVDSYGCVGSNAAIEAAVQELSRCLCLVATWHVTPDADPEALPVSLGPLVGERGVGGDVLIPRDAAPGSRVRFFASIDGCALSGVPVDVLVCCPVRGPFFAAPPFVWGRYPLGQPSAMVDGSVILPVPWRNLGSCIFAASGECRRFTLPGDTHGDVTRAAVSPELGLEFFIRSGDLGTLPQLIALNSSDRSVKWILHASKQIYSIAVLPVQGVVFTTMERKVLAIHVSDGAIISQTEPTLHYLYADPAAAEEPTASLEFSGLLAADPQSGTLYAGMRTMSHNNLALFQWTGTSLCLLRGGALEETGTFGGWIDDVTLVPARPGFHGSPCLVVAVKVGRDAEKGVLGSSVTRFDVERELCNDDGDDEDHRSYMSELRYDSPADYSLRVYSLPDLRLIARHALLNIIIGGMSLDLTGTALLVSDNHVCGVHVVPWPVPGMEIGH